MSPTTNAKVQSQRVFIAPKLFIESMKVLWIAFIMLMLIGIASVSAETFQFKNYTISFNMSQPHVVEGSIIKTYDGQVIFFNQTVRFDNGFDGYVGKYKDYTLIYYTDPIEYLLLSKAFAYIVLKDPSGYMDVAGLQIISTMNLTNTIEFIDTLKIEKAKEKAMA
jgi:hypothetical protein